MRRSKIMKKVSLLIKAENLEVATHTLYDLKLIQFFATEYDKLDELSLKELHTEAKELVELRTAITQLKPYFKDMEGAYSKDCIQKTKELAQQEKKLSQQLIQVKDIQTRKKVRLGLRLTSYNIRNGVIGYVDLGNKKLIEDYSKENRKVKQYTYGSRTYFYSNEEPIFTFKEYFIPQEIQEIASKETLQKEYNYVVSQLKLLANANLRHLQAQELKLSKEIEVEQSKEQFKQSKRHVILQGYVPQDQLHHLEISLQSHLADKYTLDIEDIKGDDAPVLLPNKGIVKSFESLLEMYSLPRYREIDPSILMVLFFPIFFGFVLGDFGYGLTAFIAFSIAKMYLPQIKHMISVMQLSAVSSMIFGIWYGEYFGFEPKLFAWEFHRSHDPNTLLLIAVAFGILHINLGLVIGIINHFKNLKKVFCDYISWMILQIAVLFFYIGSQTGVIYNYIGFILLGVTILLLYKGHGIGGIIELPSLFTNILSYARLMAVGLSSIVIAVLVNEFSVPLIQGGPISAIFGILIFTLGHVFNIILGSFEGFLHTLRLHYVEFFTKFYEGGGEEFKPFGKKIQNE